MDPVTVNEITLNVLTGMNKDISILLEGDCVFIRTPLIRSVDSEFRQVIEKLKESREKKTGHLIVLLETEGGYIETVERMVSVMRKHYKEVSFVVPSHAYSAGTVLVLSGDKIYMDYYSVLGPIDPQYDDSESESMLPGAGYLAKFKELIDQINKNGIANSIAELTYLTRRFDPARLFLIEQAIKHGESLIAEWLPKYKFKNWTQTETQKTEVSGIMRKERAEKIAKILGDAEHWHSHGRGITMHELSGGKIKLQIDDFGKDDELNNLIRHYYGLCIDFSQKNNMLGFIHTTNLIRRVF